MKDSYYRLVENSLASVSMMPMIAEGPKVWAVCRVAVQRRIRGRGLARELMAEVLADADREGVKLMLSVEPDPFGTLDYDGLVAWYRRLGFFQPYLHESYMERTPNGRARNLG